MILFKLIVIGVIGARLGVAMAYNGKMITRKVSIWSEIWKCGALLGTLYVSGFLE